MDPLQGRHLVQGAVDATGSEVIAQVAGQVAEPEGSQPVVDGHHDDVAPGSKRGAVVPGGSPLAVLVGTAVDPHVDGTSGIVTGRGDDVQVQAVFVPRNLEPVREALARQLG